MPSKMENHWAERFLQVWHDRTHLSKGSDSGITLWRVDPGGQGRSRASTQEATAVSGEAVVTGTNVQHAVVRGGWALIHFEGFPEGLEINIYMDT